MGGGEQQQHAAPSRHQTLPNVLAGVQNSCDIQKRPRDKRHRTSWERWERWERSVRPWFSCLNSTFIYPPTLDVFKTLKSASIIHVN